MNIDKFARIGEKNSKGAQAEKVLLKSSKEEQTLI